MVRGALSFTGSMGSTQFNGIQANRADMIISLLASNGCLISSHGGKQFHPAPLPVLGLSEGDKQCIHDRSSIMARHLFADKSEEFINAQVVGYQGEGELGKALEGADVVINYNPCWCAQKAWNDL